MISSYLYTIGKYLPPKQREEILSEIEANLYDYLEENYGKKEYTDAEYEDAMRSMGPPKKVASAYMSTPRCLIGPTYIDVYWLILKIALIGTAIGITVSHLITLSDTTDIFPTIYTILIDIWQGSLSTLGIITLIFVIISHHAPEEPINADEEWSLNLLEKAPESHQALCISELVFESVFICIALVFFNHPSPPEFMLLIDEKITPFINISVLRPFLIWINLILGVNLLLNVYLLIKRSWQRATRIASIFLDVAGIILFYHLMILPDWINFPLLSTVFEREHIEFGQSLNTGFRIAILVIIVLASIDIFKHVRAIIKHT